MMKTPLSRVQEEFGGKEKLVDAIVGTVERGDEDKDALRKRLLAASNTKLIRLHRVAGELKQLGGTEKLVDAILTQKGRAKDKDFRSRLLGSTPARLLDLYRAGERARAPRRPPTAKPAPKPAAKAAAKKPATKKPAGKKPGKKKGKAA